MTDVSDREYDLLYENIRATNKYNAKYCEHSRAFSNNQAEDNIDYINLIMDLNSLSKKVNGFRQSLLNGDGGELPPNGRLSALKKDLDEYQELIIEGSRLLSDIIYKSQRKLNKMGRYGYFDSKRDSDRLKKLDARRVRLEWELTDICVTFKNKRLYKPAEDI